MYKTLFELIADCNPMYVEKTAFVKIRPSQCAIFVDCDQSDLVRGVHARVCVKLRRSRALHSTNYKRGETTLILARLRWLNTVLAVSEYMSFAKLWQEKGCSSQAETWQMENISMKDFY